MNSSATGVADARELNDVQQRGNPGNTRRSTLSVQKSHPKKFQRFQLQSSKASEPPEKAALKTSERKRISLGCTEETFDLGSRVESPAECLFRGSPSRRRNIYTLDLVEHTAQQTVAEFSVWYE